MPVPVTSMPIARPEIDETAVKTALEVVVVQVGVFVAQIVVVTSRPGGTPIADGVPL